MTIPLVRTAALVVAGILWTGFFVPETLAQDDVRITVCTNQGSILNVEVDQAATFQFGEPHTNGEMVFRKVAFSDVRQLRLTPEPIGGLAAKVAELIANLGHPDYRVREEAERLLSEPKIGGRFEEMIRNARESGSMETRYRIQRILRNLVEHVNLEPAKMDRLLLTDGQQITGDATRLEIQGRVQGVSVRLKRDQIRHVFGPGEFDRYRDSRSGRQLISATTALEPAAPFFKGDHDTILDFEDDPFGSSISLNDRMNDMFVSQGLRLSSRAPSYIRSIRFSFKLCPMGEGIKAICVHDPETNRTFRGVTNIDFCIPGQPDVAAGVHRFGVFVERVDHSRDFVAEALDAFGHVIGYSESTDQGCWFVGFESQVPIARVRIFQNPYLPNSARNLDEMYALDNLTFATPVLLQPRPAWMESPAHVQCENGDILAIRKLRLNSTGVSGYSDELQRSISLDRESVRSIQWDRSSSSDSDAMSDSDAHWYVMLKDGSIVLCQYQNGFQVPAWGDHPLSLDDVIGFWPANHPARSAPPEDFESDKPVVVFPGCRILAEDLVVAGGTLEWNPESERRIQPVLLAGNETESELDDPCPNVSLVRLDAPTPAPTVWLHPPYLETGRTQLVTTDGQRWMTDSRGMFTIKTIGDQGIEVQFQGVERMIGIDNLRFGQFK